jgi:molecular chaperone HtpG
MNDHKERLAFEVETSRILQILASEIYDSPKAFLRENVQNAYDAILMRCTEQNLLLAERSIIITVEPSRLIVKDDGIGMDLDVLKNNFWKAGSSGKRSELAQRSGVIGTFGIGAMANFGVCTALRVETRSIKSNVTLISSAIRENLRIAQDCIDLDRVIDQRGPGTTIIADLDPSFSVDEAGVCDYLRQYVRFLPVPLLVNGKRISGESFQDAFTSTASGFVTQQSRPISGGEFAGTLETFLNPQGRALVRFTDIKLNGNPLAGEVLFVQQGGQTLGFRNLFGLAPIPVSSAYGFGGYVNLNILHPTAGREALSRESIQHVANIVDLVENEVSKDIAQSLAADQNVDFQNYILARGLSDLAGNLKIIVLPSREEVALAQIPSLEPEKTKHYYTGRDQTTLTRFASEQSNLLHVSQVNPRRNLQIAYLRDRLHTPEIPEKTIVEHVPASKLTIEETIFLIRVRGILIDDYLMSNVNVDFATISHGVAVDVEIVGDAVQIAISQTLPAARMVVECYRTARDVFEGFAKDFVREHLYPHIRNHVPSSTRQGRDVLLRRLKENKELFRYEEREYGKIESLLADYLAGKADLGEVLRSSGGHAPSQRQEVSREQVGSVESEMPDIIQAVGESPARTAFEPAPPILRPELSSPMKVLTVSAEYAKLNNFKLFLGLSDRLMRTEGEFLRWPHTTKLMWGMHRVIYIFTDATGSLSLYYDIELKEPLPTAATGGAMIPTTTIMTKNRVYVPVPAALEPTFQITSGAKEFYVRFDTIP